MPKFAKGPKNLIIYEDKALFVCLASKPFAKAHTLVVWKDNVADLHSLGHADYAHLMRIVERTRNALLRTFKTDKVYLFYMDEYRHVHWHLLPRFKAKGFNIVLHPPKKNVDAKVVEEIRKNFARK